MLSLVSNYWTWSAQRLGMIDWPTPFQTGHFQSFWTTYLALRSCKNRSFSHSFMLPLWWVNSTLAFFFIRYFWFWAHGEVLNPTCPKTCSSGICYMIIKFILARFYFLFIKQWQNHQRDDILECPRICLQSWNISRFYANIFQI